MKIDLSTQFPFDILSLLCAGLSYGMPAVLWYMMQGWLSDFGPEDGTAVAIGISALMTICVLFSFLAAVPGTICSIIGIVRIPQRRPIAITGLVLNGIVLVVFGVFVVLSRVHS